MSRRYELQDGGCDIVRLLVISLKESISLVKIIFWYFMVTSMCLNHCSFNSASSQFAEVFFLLMSPGSHCVRTVIITTDWWHFQNVSLRGGKVTSKTQITWQTSCPDQESIVKEIYLKKILEITLQPLYSKHQCFWMIYHN